MSIYAKLVEHADGAQVWVWCPGCDSLHPFTVRSGGDLNRGVTWEWDGNLESPTFSPSLLCHAAVHVCEGEHDPPLCPNPDSCGSTSHAIGAVVDGEVRWRFPHGVPDDAERVYACQGNEHTSDPAWGPCHSFLRAGRWEFLSDSAHHLAGQTVDMVPLPVEWRGSDNEETP